MSTSFKELLDLSSAILKTQGTAELQLAVPDLEEKQNFTKICQVFNDGIKFL